MSDDTSHNSSKSSPARPPSSVRAILGNERYYGDGPPEWLQAASRRPCQTAREAEAERRRDVQRLHRFGKANPGALCLAGRIDKCEAGTRCMSGACAACRRAWQRWSVEALSDFLGEHSSILCPVHSRGLVIPGNLGLTVLRSLSDAVIDVFSAAKIEVAVLGLDVSFNEHEQNLSPTHWCLHLRAHVPGKISSSAIQKLRRSLPRTLLISRPLTITNWDGDLAAVAYSAKATFGRRQTYTQVRPHRACQNTRGRPLRGTERVELAIFLDQIGLRRRLILHGADLVLDRNGRVRIRRKGRTGPLGQPGTSAQGDETAAVNDQRMNRDRSV